MLQPHSLWPYLLWPYLRWPYSLWVTNPNLTPKPKPDPKQLAIEYLVKLVEHCWRAFFGAEAARVRATLDTNGKWGGQWAAVNEMCSLAHNLLKLLIKRNRRCADALQSVDAVELLLEQLPSGWNPPVIEVFDALMRLDMHGASDAKGGGGYQLYKSDIKALVDQIHEQLSRKVGYGTKGP